MKGKLGKNLWGEELVILAEASMEPVVIYVKQVLDIVSKASNKGIKGIAHVPGGGFIDTICRVFGIGIGALVYNDPCSVPPDFKWIQKAGGIEDGEMKRTFNMGIRMVLVVSKEVSERVVKEEGEMVYCVGEVFSDSPRDSVQFIEWSPSSCPRALPGQYAPVNQHFFVARMDMAVDCKPGEAYNQVVEVDVKVEEPGKDNVHNNAFYTQETLLKSESQAMRDCNLLSARHWIESFRRGFMPWLSSSIRLPLFFMISCGRSPPDIFLFASHRFLLAIVNKHQVGGGSSRGQNAPTQILWFFAHHSCFLEIDLGHLKGTNEVSWHGPAEDQAYVHPPYIMMTFNFDIHGFRPFSGTKFSSSESINFTADISKGLMKANSSGVRRGKESSS
ncbi:unnamed protein product [Lactuca saligna]|uniref:phosphoribosylformylglycinamidine cyclo-ligase n=1 Tax=Lactuca saligna TaxID=75948 RepID=A0AA35VPT0_LACSI|nr:unnamed protein product [Lactuca saligna]